MNVRDEGDILERERAWVQGTKMERKEGPSVGRRGRGEKMMKNAPKSDMSSVYKEIKG